ncbi:hypothetical protein ACJX0J_011672 [Zea mays]
MAHVRTHALLFLIVPISICQSDESDVVAIMVQSCDGDRRKPEIHTYSHMIMTKWLNVTMLKFEFHERTICLVVCQVVLETWTKTLRLEEEMRENMWIGMIYQQMT